MTTIKKRVLHQKKKECREATICSDFQELRQQYPDIEITCIFDTLAEKYRKRKSYANMQYPKTGMGVRSIVIRKGFYKPQSDR